MRFAVLGLLAAGCALAQQSTSREPHRTVYEDARVRILEVQAEPRGPAAPHRHDTDYVWLDGTGMHFSRAGTAHVEQNHEIIVELLQRQGPPRNVCGEVLPGEYLHCRESGAEWLGANLQVQLETDQTHFGILEIAPNAALAVPPADVPPVFVALDGTDAQTASRVNGAPAANSSWRNLKPADVVRSPADLVSEIRNAGKTAARFLVVEFGGAGE